MLSRSVYCAAILLTPLAWACASEDAPPAVDPGATDSGTSVDAQNGPFVPVVIAADQAAPYDIAVDDVFIYWVNRGDPECRVADGALMRTPKDLSGPPEQLLTGLHHPWRLALDESHVYWLDYGCPANEDGVLYRASKASNEVQVLATNLRGPSGLALDTTHAYWRSRSGSSDGLVRRVTKTGGAPETLASGQGGGGVLRIRDGYVYWINDREYEMWRLPTSGGAREWVMGWSGMRHTALVVDDKHAFWTLCREPPCLQDIEPNSILRTSVEDHDAVELSAGSPAAHFSGAFVGGGNHLYAARHFGSIVRLPKSGGATTLVVAGSDDAADSAQAIALDGPWVYWVSPPVGRVARIRRPE